MGIPYYFSHIIKQHRDIIIEKSSLSNIENLYLDANSIIYDQLNIKTFQCKNEVSLDDYIEEFENTLICSIIEKIYEYIDIVKPSKRVFVAFDGVAPIAKLSQQRNRRYKASFQKTFLSSKEKKGTIDTWDHASITPGTNFMKKLSRALLSEFHANPPSDVVDDLYIWTSTSKTPGEGEHKIFEYIRREKKYHRETNTFIYGLDSDLFMLALNHSHQSNYKLYLYRETPVFIKSLDETLEPNKSYAIDIPLLAIQIHKMMASHHTSASLKARGSMWQEKPNESLLYDYIFLCFLLGNDFVAKTPSLNIRMHGLDHIIRGYQRTAALLHGNQSKVSNRFHLIKCISDEQIEIHWNHVKYLISTLAELEHDRLIKIHTQRTQPYVYREHENTIEHKLLCIPMTHQNTERRINPSKIGWGSRYYNELFDFEESNDDAIKKCCLNYFESLEWTMKYYTHGCPDWHWKYSYEYAPLLNDMVRYIPCFDKGFISKNMNEPIHELMLLAYVTPKASIKRLLPGRLYEIIFKGHPEWYMDDCKFRWAYCRYFWECHAVMNEIDLKELSSYIHMYLENVT